MILSLLLTAILYTMGNHYLLLIIVALISYCRYEVFKAMIDSMPVCAGNFLSLILSYIIGANMFTGFPYMMLCCVAKVTLLVGDNCSVIMTIAGG